MAASLAAKIKKAERAFGNARKRAKEEGLGNLPDSSYRGRIKEAKIGESGNGRLQHILAIKISEGDFKGEVARKYSGMDSEDSIMYLQKDIGRLTGDGFDTMEELEDINTELIGLYVRFKLVTKGANDFQNLYIDKVLATDEGADDPDDDAPEVPAAWVEFKNGDRVSVEIDGETYEGEITEWGSDSCTVTFDDEDVQDVDNEDLTLLDSDETTPLKEPEPEGLDVGDRVIALIDGTEYAGVIKSVDGTVATVKFDDGDVDDFEIEDLDPADVADDPDTGDIAVEKGSEVEVKVGRKTIDAVVTLVSSKKGTINIKDDEGNVYKDIPIAKILTVYGDED